MGRESMNLRGQVFELDSEGKTGADGMPLAVSIRGVTPSGDAAETFSISDGSARWKSPIDAGTASYFGPAFYPPQGGPIDLTAWFLEALLARPRQNAQSAAGRQSARGETDRPRNRRGLRKAHNRAMVRHRHLHVANADMVGRTQ